MTILEMKHVPGQADGIIKVEVKVMTEEVIDVMEFTDN